MRCRSMWTARRRRATPPSLLFPILALLAVAPAAALDQDADPPPPPVDPESPVDLEQETTPTEVGEEEAPLDRVLGELTGRDDGAPDEEPKWNSLASPRATTMTFLEAINDALLGREEAWSRVVRTMDFSQTPPNADPRDLAEQLLGVFNRLGEVSPGDLPDADAVREAAISRYNFFPVAAEHRWVWDELEGAPQGKIVLELDEAGAWRFSAATVAGIPVLYESMRALPPLYEERVEAGRLLRVVGPTFEETAWWHWLTLLVAIFLGLLLGKLARYTLRKIGDTFADRGERYRACLFNDVAGPVGLAIFTAFLAVGLSFVYLEPTLGEARWAAIVLLLLTALGWLLYNLVDLVDLVLGGLVGHTSNRFDDMVVPLVRKTLRIFLLVIFVIIVLQNVFGMNVLGFLAGLGIAGLALSLAAQDSVKNLFGSLTLFFDKPFLVGDFISFGENTGTVEEIGFRSTRIRLLSGHLVTVPNMQFIDNDVENISLRPYIRREMNITITYDTTPEKVREAIGLLEGVLRDPEIVEEGRFDLEELPPRVAFNEFNAASLNLRAYYWYRMDGDPDRGWFTYLDHATEVNVRLLRAFNDAGIEFAFPTQMLYVTDDHRGLSVRVLPPEALPPSKETSRSDSSA